MKKNSNILFPIGLKLVLIISVIVIISLSSITALVSYFTTENDKLKAESNNFTINSRSAGIAQNFFTQTQSDVFILLDLIDTIGKNKEKNDNLFNQSTSYFFERNQQICAIIQISNKTNEKEINLINQRFLQKNEIKLEDIDNFIESESENITNAFLGEDSVLNTTVYFNTTSLGIIYSHNKKAVIVITSVDSISDTFCVGNSSTSYIINANNDILVHPNIDFINLSTNVSNSPIVKQLRENHDSGRQIFFTDNDKNDYFGAYQKLSFANLVVITTIKAEIIYESIKATTRRNIYLTFAIFFLAIIFIAIYSKLLSRRIKRLTKASAEIEVGRFNVKIKNSSNDELTVLTKSFMKMGRGLAERERLKDTFGRFINKEIAQKAMKGELKLGGETKNVTIFFSDIRSFTAISEKLEPSEVVEFLNEYMTKMVDCVNKTGGVVDKFIGDALMGVWGAPVSSGSVEKDAFNCVCAALMMREALIEFNKTRGGDKKPIIKIGCGINTGPVIAGQIGSEQRMEYTVIGDAVNLASRTESLNKPFCTDILITDNTYNLIKDYLIVEEMPSVTVKGKEKPVKMYAVINTKNVKKASNNEENEMKSLAEVRAKLGFDTPDLSTVNPNESEKKYKVGGSK